MMMFFYHIPVIPQCKWKRIRQLHIRPMRPAYGIAWENQIIL